MAATFAAGGFESQFGGTGFMGTQMQDQGMGGKVRRAGRGEREGGELLIAVDLARAPNRSRATHLRTRLAL